MPWRETDGAARGEAEFIQTIPSRDRGRRSQTKKTNVSLSERRSQTDAKPRAISSLLEYCRGAKEEDEVSFLDYAERTPLTEAERLKRQKMIVLPVMVLVFLGAMWLIFAPSSDETKEPGMDGYNMEMPDADKADRQIIGDKAKAYEQGALEERKENRNRSMMELGDMFDREVAGNESAADFSLTANDSAEKSEPATPQSIRSSATAYRDLNTTLGSFYEQPKEENADMEELLERIASLESELESEKGRASDMDDQVALMEKSYELAAKYMGEDFEGDMPTDAEICIHNTVPTATFDISAGIVTRDVKGKKTTIKARPVSTKVRAAAQDDSTTKATPPSKTSPRHRHHSDHIKI